MTITEMPTQIHHGRNIKRFREMLGIKQEVLADELGWSQSKISQLEAKEEVDEELLEQVAKVLKVPAEAIKNFTEQSAVSYFNTFNDHSINQGAVVGSTNYNCNFNPLDELIKTIDENKKLYERLLQSERELLQAEKEKNELLQKMLEQK